MPRKPREEAPGAVHHVVAKGNRGQAIVRDDTDRRSFFVRLDKAVEMHGWVCLAYCLLDNHFHLVLQTPEPNMGVGMRWFQSAHAQDVNFRHGLQGHVFGGRYYSVRLKQESHLISAVVYVLMNPVRAGVARHPEEWPWCSYAGTIGRAAAPRLLARDTVLELFGGEPRVLVGAVPDALARDRPAVSTGV
jgi:putative transposase